MKVTKTKKKNIRDEEEEKKEYQIIEMWNKDTSFITAEKIETKVENAGPSVKSNIRNVSSEQSNNLR